MQDRRRQFDEIFLRRTAGPYMQRTTGPYIWVRKRLMHCNKSVFTRSPCLLEQQALSGE
jgi:hypothetical protein